MCGGVEQRADDHFGAFFVRGLYVCTALAWSCVAATVSLTESPLFTVSRLSKCSDAIGKRRLYAMCAARVAHNQSPTNAHARRVNTDVNTRRVHVSARPNSA